MIQTRNAITMNMDTVKGITVATVKAIIADTVKGRGVSFMENNILWHYRTPQGEEYEAALAELEASRP